MTAIFQDVQLILMFLCVVQTFAWPSALRLLTDRECILHMLNSHKIIHAREIAVDISKKLGGLSLHSCYFELMQKYFY